MKQEMQAPMVITLSVLLLEVAQATMEECLEGGHLQLCMLPYQLQQPG